MLKVFGKHTTVLFTLVYTNKLTFATIIGKTQRIHSRCKWNAADYQQTQHEQRAADADVGKLPTKCQVSFGK